MIEFLCWLGWHRHDEHATYLDDDKTVIEVEYCGRCGVEFRRERVVLDSV